MNGQSFPLQPFPPGGPRLDYEITGALARRGPRLAIRYALRGRLAELAIPAPAVAPARRHGLWEGTCFELFLAVKDAPGYWEFNLSPAGHWNVYRFSDYRQGMEEEMAFTSLPFRVQSGWDSLLLVLELGMDSILSSNQALEVAIAVVTQRRNGEVIYWALTYAGPQPDFHRRDGFIIELWEGVGGEEKINRTARDRGTMR